MNKPKKSDSPWRAAGIVGFAGFDLAICICGGYFLGAYVSERTGGHYGWLIAGLLAGLAVGILTVVLLIKKVLEDTNE